MCFSSLACIICTVLVFPPALLLVLFHLVRHVVHVVMTCTGVDVDGLYRISGKANELLKLKKEFDNGRCRTLMV